jgi:hypothetical protein
MVNNRHACCLRFAAAGGVAVLLGGLVLAFLASNGLLG